MLDQDNSFQLMSLSILMTCLLDNILIYSERSYSLINPESQWFNNSPFPERSVRLPVAYQKQYNYKGNRCFILSWIIFIHTKSREAHTAPIQIYNVQSVF